MEATTSEWAEREFGSAQLGNELRTRRAVRLAAAALSKPAGTVTSVIKSPAEREGAFRFLENPKVKAAELARSSHLATARRCKTPWVFVATDQTTLSITDHQCSKGLGPCGNRRSGKKRGAEVMSALALTPEGRPLGLLAQQWWRRSEERSPDYDHDLRPAEQRESDLWLQALQQVQQRFEQAEVTSKPWFQLDRGADFWRVFEFAQDHDAWVTVRSAYDRCLWSSEQPLRQHLANVRVRAKLAIHVPAQRLPKKPPRRARTATVELRYEPVELELTDHDGHRFVVEVTVVHIQEKSRRPDRLQWWLLTTYPVRTVADAKLVIHGYSQRWRVESFHRAWKTGACNVERSQLRSPDAFCRWATILAAVAARIEQLKHLSRTAPDQPALEHLSRAELDAAIVLSETRKFAPGDAMTLGQAVELIAQAGGYTGKSSGGPPGTITLTRGFRDVQAAAAVVERLQKT